VEQKTRKIFVDSVRGLRTDRSNCLTKFNKTDCPSIITGQFQHYEWTVPRLCLWEYQDDVTTELVKGCQADLSDAQHYAEQRRIYLVIAHRNNSFKYNRAQCLETQTR
jgi:hypothetical protein